MTHSTPSSGAGVNPALQLGSLKTGGRLSHWSFGNCPDEKKITGALRSLFRILLIMVHEFSNTNIALRASALTFSVVLSMVPLLAMSTAILKGLGNGDQMRIAAYHFIDQLDPEVSQQGAQDPPPQVISERASLEDVPAGAAAGNAAPENPAPENPAPGDAEVPPSLNRHLHQAIDTIFDYVDNTNFAALGAIGIAGLLIVVIMVLSSIEDAMNAIWHTRRGRSLFRKIMDYLALLVLLPISINIALAGDAVLQSPKIMDYLITFIPSAWVVQMLLKLLPFIFITLSLMMMYLFFPNVRVKTTAAFCGALFGAVFWFIVQRVYVVLQVGVAKYNAIYGSFATVPLFLVWIQLGWMFILLGAVLAYAIQHRNSYQLSGTTSSTRQDLQRTFDILITVYNNFAVGRATSLDQLVEQCQVVNETDLARPLDLLIQGDLLHEIDQDEASAFIPSRPLEQVDAARIIQLILGKEGEAESVGGHLADQVVKAAEQVLPAEEFLKKYLTKRLTHHGQAAEEDNDGVVRTDSPGCSTA
ncbi:MAG: YihY/virulence factor BrkB family protein [Candidatus Electrothrix sp. GW3-4]|uniref:YihY/virulence factor BrkB family protein n=1 Tax=Candidatus Electrothrix sp. GW3-4 TaxID=3126740 RepID=UPI0030D322A1